MRIRPGIYKPYQRNNVSIPSLISFSGLILAIGLVFLGQQRPAHINVLPTATLSPTATPEPSTTPAFTPTPMATTTATLKPTVASIWNLEDGMDPSYSPWTTAPVPFKSGLKIRYTAAENAVLLDAPTGIKVFTYPLKGMPVYLTEKPAVTENGTTWVEVRDLIGAGGWIQENSLVKNDIFASLDDICAQEVYKSAAITSSQLFEVGRVTLIETQQERYISGFGITDGAVRSMKISARFRKGK